MTIRSVALLPRPGLHPRSLSRQGPKRKETSMIKSARRHLKYVVSSFAAVVFAVNC